MITESRKQEIYDIIKDKDLWSKTFEEIAESQGDIVLRVVDFSQFEVEAVKNASGFIFFNNGENKFYIGVNSQSGDKRRRFTIAHELGHYFLHQPALRNNETIIDQTNASYLFQTHGQIYSQIPEDLRIREEEANEFAAELLMPASKIQELYYKFKTIEEDLPIKKLADIFNVSIQAMTFRLINLGLVRNE